MTMEIELAKQNGIQYRLTPDGTTEMWCHDSDVQAFAEAVRAAACAERDARIAELERHLENEKRHSKNMTQDRDLWMLTASERGHQLEEAREKALEDAAALFSQPHIEYFGDSIQDLIRSLKEAP